MVGKKKRKQIRFDLSLHVYPKDAIFGACYRFIDTSFVYLDHPEPGTLTVTLVPKKDMDVEALRQLSGEFSNELLHELLRNRIGKKTGSIREMIVGRALLSAEPPEDPPEMESFDLDYLDDPLGIAVPWEEKFSKDSSADPSSTSPTDKGNPR